MSVFQINETKEETLHHPLINRIGPEIEVNHRVADSRETDTYSGFLDMTILIPPRATSLKRIWKPLNSFPIMMNIPKGFMGYSTSGRKPGSRRKESATFVG